MGPWRRPLSSYSPLRDQWLGLDGADVVFACPARVYPIKEHATLLTAFAEVRRARPAARLLLIGTGTNAETGRFARLRDRVGIAGSVIALGERTRDDIALVQAADSVVLSSAFGEGFPNVLGAAMSLKIPCITTDVGDAAHVVGETGWVVSRRDPDALARATEALYNMPEPARERLGEAARAWIADRFRLESVLASYAKTLPRPRQHQQRQRRRAHGTRPARGRARLSRAA